MPNNFHLDRRAMLFGLAGFATIAPTFGFALSDKSAATLIRKLVKDINRVINSGRPETKMYADFEKVFDKYGDVPIIARSALGYAWRQASKSQRIAYVNAFRGYMARKYGKRFREFIGGKIVVTKTRKVRSGYLVTSTVHLSGSSPFEVDWQVSDKSGQDKMFNMYIEGISLLATERTEIGAMLERRKGDIDQLIIDLKTAG